ncbi:hypothetical protein GAY33_01295 [Azospirillum brasilense]|uniref:hypothetical protein n=1 Tax=Azospirillum argentinense TaxID=2970906 RepID=UPI00190AEBFE|nr:hypothetical protein [Azospirillum argentinense]MBK3797889.1 hypothetical protein [Azospirillum argentinense]
MKKIANSLSGIELALFIVLGGFLIFLWVNLQGAFPESGKLASSADAREIATALSTPPSHLADPFWKRLYHWQTLVAGVLAFIGGLAAVGAAFIGAQALKDQTNKMVAASNNAAEQNLKAIQLQLDAQESRDIRSRNFELQQLATAFHAEVTNIVDQNKDHYEGRMFQKMKGSLEDFNRAFSGIHVDSNRPEIYDSLRDKIGIFPGEIPRQLVQLYATYASLITSMQHIKDKKIVAEDDEDVVAICNNMQIELIQILEIGPKVLDSLSKMRGEGYANNIRKRRRRRKSDFIHAE